MRSRMVPAGTRASTTSPTFLLRSAWAMGDFTEIFPSRRLASLGPGDGVGHSAVVGKVGHLHLAEQLHAVVAQPLRIYHAGVGGTFCLKLILLSSRVWARLAA